MAKIKKPSPEAVEKPATNPTAGKKAKASVAPPIAAEPVAAPQLAPVAPSAASPSKKKPVAAEKVKAAAPATKSAAQPKPAAKPAGKAISTDDIALRAYFIAEKRRTHGLPGNEHHDWVEAERQLVAESGKAKRAKKSS